MPPWTEEELRFHAEVIHMIFEGVNTGNSELTSQALSDLERWATRKAFLRGLLLGVMLGAILTAAGFACS